MPDVEIPNPEDLTELRSQAFTRRVALTAVVYAVILSINALGGNNAGKDMVLAQMQASDQWAYYQAKAVREQIYKVERLKLELEIAAAADAPEAVRTRRQALLEQFAGEEARYATEKAEIKRTAEALERARDVNQARDPYFDYAEVLLQIAIVMATLAVLAGSARVYGFSMLLASLGSLLTLNGYLLLVKVPLLG